MKKKPVYNINDVLVFVGDTDSHKFETGKKYKILSKGSIDYDHEDVGTRECIFFENCDYGCYDDYADAHFIKVEDDRDYKLDKLLE